MHLANLPVIFLALVVSATALKLDIPKGRDNGDDDISLRSRSFGHFRLTLSFVVPCLHDQFRQNVGGFSPVVTRDEEH